AARLGQGHVAEHRLARQHLGVGVEAVEVGDEAALDAPATRAAVGKGDQVARGVVCRCVAVRPVGAAHLFAALEDALAAEGLGRRPGKELAQHVLCLADQEEVDELGERLGVEKGGRTAGDDERPVRAPLPAPEGNAGQPQAVEHVHVVGLERERERDHVEVAERAVPLEGAQGPGPLGARAVGEKSAVGGDARVLGQDAEHGLEPQIRHADCVGVRIDEADGEWAARAGAKETSLGGATIGWMGHRRPDPYPAPPPGSTRHDPGGGSERQPGPVHEHVDRAEELAGPVVLRAELLGDADRADVLLVDEVHDVVGPERSVHPVGGGTRRLGRVAAPPARTVDGPADLEVWPPFRLPRADAADELAGCLLLDGPERIAAQVPVADEEADRLPGLGRVRRLLVAAEVAHRLLVGREARVRLEVLGLPRPEDQAFGLERGPVEVHAYALAWARAGRSTPSRDGSLQRFAGRSPHHGPRGDLTHAQGSPYRGHPSQLPPNPAAAVSARLAVLPSAVQREIRQRSKRRRLASLHAYTLCTFRLEDAPAFLDTAGITEISMATAPAMALLRQWQLLSTFLT